MSEHKADHSPLPWTIRGEYLEDAKGYTITAWPEYEKNARVNRELAVRAANAYPLAEEMARWIAEHEWSDEGDWCPQCQGSQSFGPRPGEHDPDCDLARLLQAARDAGLLADRPNRRAELRRCGMCGADLTSVTINGDSWLVCSASCGERVRPQS